MRTSSSRQLVGWVGEELKKGVMPSGPTALDVGIIASSACTFGSLALKPGTTVRSGVWPVLSRKPGTAGQSLKSGLPDVLVAGFGQRSLKCPVRLASEGTAKLKVWPGTLSFRHSSDQKKNVFCLSMLSPPSSYQLLYSSRPPFMLKPTLPYTPTVPSSCPV